MQPKALAEYFSEIDDPRRTGFAHRHDLVEILVITTCALFAEVEGFEHTEQTRVEALIRLMVLNRLCDPEPKLGVLRWVQTAALPEFAPKTVTHQQLLRSLDALMDHQDEVDAVVAGLLRPLIDQDLSVVFYDFTGAASLSGQQP